MMAAASSIISGHPWASDFLLLVAVLAFLASLVLTVLARRSSPADSHRAANPASLVPVLELAGLTCLALAFLVL